jgi:hypothetical protein
MSCNYAGMTGIVIFAGVLSLGAIAHASGHGASAEPEVEEEDEASAAAVRGIELGEYRIRSYYPVQAQKSIVQFALHAATAGDRFSETKRLAAQRKQKIRDQVIVAARMAPLSEFDDPDLKTFRRRILLRLRRAVPELTIDDIYLSEFQLNVQSL